MLLLNLTFDSQASPLTVDDSVIVKRIGQTYLFVFPSAMGRFAGASQNPAGKLEIGQTVTIEYALKIIKGGKARFIGVDGSQLSSAAIDAMRVKLSVEPKSETFGFIVRDSKQPVLHVHINPSFMAEKRSKAEVKEKIAREGNLNVILQRDKDGVKILKVYLD